MITGPNFVADSKNIEFIPGMKHNAEEVSEIALKFHFGSGDVMQKILLLKYALIIIFRISSSTIIFWNLCNLQKSQTVCLTNSTMAWTAFSSSRIIVLQHG